MVVNFLVNEPVAFIPEEKALVIAELHLGLENELFKKGIVIPPQRENFQKKLERLLKLVKAETLIIIGDIKHKVPGMSLREEKELPKFLQYLKERVELILVKGNHDGKIEEIVPKNVKVYGSEGFKLKKYGFFHGHAWPKKELMKCEYLFSAHLHPAFEFKDKLGLKRVEQVWVKGKVDEEKVKEKYKIRKIGKGNLIIIPAFNKLLGSVKINKLIEKEEQGILTKIMEIENARIYLLDGTFLGILKELKSD